MSEDNPPSSEDVAEPKSVEPEAAQAEVELEAEPEAEPEPQAHAHHALRPEDPSKRRFFTIATHVLGVCVGCTIAVPTLAVVLHPLIADTRKKGTGDGFLPVAAAGRFTVGAHAVRVVVKADRTDAWVSTRGVPIGSVLVKRTAADKFLLFSAKCPHLGCAVNPVAGEDAFKCPCHNSSFAGDGSLVEKSDGAANPAPRGLDKLEWRIKRGELQVKYINYKTGTKEPVPIV